MRLSVVDFVNAWPLSWGFLEDRVPGVEIVRDPPSVCAERLAAGEVDGGLVPVASLVDLGPEFEVVRGLGIAARSEVRSVLLLARRPLDQLRRVALDPASRSSAALVRLLLAEAGAAPDYEWRPIGQRPLDALDDADAVLVIGDPALGADVAAASNIERHDLAAVWHHQTGLPFVFAVWAVRPGTSPEPFVRSREIGRQSLTPMIDRASRHLGVTAEVARTYLTENLTFDLGHREEEGLDRFLTRATDLGIISGSGRAGSRLVNWQVAPQPERSMS